MSLCIRPVVETWGESLTYLSRETNIDEILGNIASQIPLEYHVSEHNDMTVVYFHDGVAFLAYLETTPIETIMDCLANDELTSSDDEEYSRQRSDINDLKEHARIWRKSVDPVHGTLRIYCD